MKETLTPDVCVIGAGSGGLAFSAAAAAFGVDVVLIERGEMGGDCLNYGCVPSKALLAAAKCAQSARQGAKFGVDIAADAIKVDHARVNDHVRSVIESIAPHDSQERFESLGVTVLRDEGRFASPDEVEAAGKRIRARRFVLATGSSPFVPPIPGVDGVPYFTNETLFSNRDFLPELIVIGGGPIGMEMAQAHARLGSKVTVLEAFKALGRDDPELASVLLDSLRGEGIDIREGAKVTGVAKGKGKGKNAGVSVSVETESGVEEIKGSHLLVAVGRVPNLEGLALERAGIEHDRRGVKVDSRLRTSNRKVCAIGDVAGSLQFTHMAGYHAGLAIRSILFRMKAVPDTSIIPWATYTDPEMAHVGLSEAQASESKLDFSVLRWRYAENDRAVAERKTEGLIKVIVGRKGRILGASIVGASAGEMINFWSLAVMKKLSVRDIASYVAPYPTLGEIGKRAATSHFAPMAGNAWIRRAIRLMRSFG